MAIVYKEINDFINTLPDIWNTTNTGDIASFRTLMVGLRDGLIDQTNTKSNVVAVKDFYDTRGLQLSGDQKTLLEDIFTKLTDKSVSAAIGGTIYKRKQVLQDIVNLITKNIAPAWQTVQVNQIDPLDMTNVIMPNMCKILAFYTIVSDTCPNANVKIVANAAAIKSANASWSARWKIILIVLWIIVGIFVILVIVFAVRARMNQQEESLEAPPEV